MQDWQDLAVGQVLETNSIRLSKQDIAEFAREFDPQPYHLDDSAAKDSIFGGLCASGWQICALVNRLVSGCFAAKGIPLLGIGRVSALSWKLPVFAEDRLSGTISIAELGSESQPAILVCDIALKNQDQKLVVKMKMELRVRSHATEALIK